MATTLIKAFDASTPPHQQFPGCVAVCGYVGGMTPHVWTLDEWLRFQHLKQLPIWVADPAVSAAGQGKSAVDATRMRGWKAHAPIERAIALDMETIIAPGFIADFAHEVHRGGYQCWVYGSESFVTANPAEDGYWSALYNNVPSMTPIPHEVGRQYAAGVAWEGGQVDLSVFASTALQHFGDGPRH